MLARSRVQTVPTVRKVPHPYAQIAEHYRRRIRAQDPGPGEKFHSIAEIADAWGISLATAQRAVNLLKETGWVRAEHGRGTYVADHPPP